MYRSVCLAAFLALALVTSAFAQNGSYHVQNVYSPNWENGAIEVRFIEVPDNAYTLTPDVVGYQRFENMLRLLSSAVIHDLRVWIEFDNSGNGPNVIAVSIYNSRFN